MGLRFRRSVRLFPGVRLNFSGSGVSTSIGVRGASVTLGKRGAHLNVGIPGSGLSYRTRIGGHEPAPRPRFGFAESDTPPPRQVAGNRNIPGTEEEIRSADVSALTSPGLIALKKLINEAAVRKVELTHLAATSAEAVRKAAGRLRWAEALVIRLFTENMVPRLVDGANAAHDAHEDAKARLEGCYVEVDFDLSSGARESYAHLVRAFEAVSKSNCIWDITSRADVNRFAERTTASTALTRQLVSFERVAPELVRSTFDCLRLGNVNGRPVQIYPGFLMMREDGGDFALIEYAEVDFRFTPSNFIEEEVVPPDAEQISSTWKYSNKNGSPDRRFSDNYQIPIMRYGGLGMSSGTGLAEAYMISNFGKTAEFALALAGHQRSLAVAHEIEKTQALPPPAHDDETFEGAPPYEAKPRPNLAGDWVLLTVLIAVIGMGVGWVGDGWAQLSVRQPSSTATTPVAVLVEPIAPKPAPSRKLARSDKQSKTAVPEPASLKGVEPLPPAIEAAEGNTTQEIIDQIY